MPTHFPVGKAAVVEEEPGMCNLPTVVIGAQASQERFSEITSGRTRWEQGLVATCKASSNETKVEAEESQMGLAHELVVAMTEG
jgi:hypothetical protein